MSNTTTKKTVCPISRTAFRQLAKPILARLGDKDIKLAVKEFSTGSIGWGYSDKMTVTLKANAATKEEFEQVAPRLVLTLVGLGKSVEAGPKAMSTGSAGWNFNDKADVMVGTNEVKCQLGCNVTVVKSKEKWTPGVEVTCQVGLNLTVVGSKELPQS